MSAGQRFAEWLDSIGGTDAIDDFIERTAADRVEARRAARETFVDCAGCGGPFRGRGLLCAWCRNHSRASADTPRVIHGRC